MRTIKAKHKAEYEPVGDLITYRAMPTPHFEMNSLDPFIFLNHHGYQEYAPGNKGLPFGPRPHRGFETVTFIVHGDLTHKDSSGGENTITAGGVQWMRAGRGLTHAEISSEDFKDKGGPVEILQLWINLPARFKMTDPAYKGLQKEEIPVKEWDNGKVVAQLVSGTFDGVKGAFETLTDIHLITLRFLEGGKHNFEVSPDKSVFLYVVSGEIRVNGEIFTKHHIAEFSHEGKMIELKANTASLVLFGYATPFHEPFMAYGPFVMNTKEEIMQAYEDYNRGLFG